MCTGAAFGRVVDYFISDAVPMQISVLCMAAGMNVAITRTSLASTLILAFLPGEPCAIPPILMASLSSLFATAYLVGFGSPAIFGSKLHPAYLFFRFFRSHLLKVKLREVILIIVFFTKRILLKLRRHCRTTTKSKVHMYAIFRCYSFILHLV